MPVVYDNARSLQSYAGPVDAVPATQITSVLINLHADGAKATTCAFVSLSRKYCVRFAIPHLHTICDTDSTRC